MYAHLCVTNKRKTQCVYTARSVNGMCARVAILVGERSTLQHTFTTVWWALWLEEPLGTIVVIMKTIDVCMCVCGRCFYFHFVFSHIEFNINVPPFL